MKFCSIETATAETIEAALDEAYKAVSGRAMKKPLISEPSYYGSETKGRDAKIDLKKARAMAEQGLILTEAAAALEMSRQGLRNTAKRYGIRFADGRKKRGAQ